MLELKTMADDGGWWLVDEGGLDEDCFGDRVQERDVRGCWWMLVGVGGCWWMLVGAGGCWWMLVGAAGWWGMLVGVGGCW